MSSIRSGVTSTNIARPTSSHPLRSAVTIKESERSEYLEELRIENRNKEITKRRELTTESVMIAALQADILINGVDKYIDD